MQKKLLGGAVSLSHHRRRNNDVYILGDQHKKFSTTTDGECVSDVRSHSMPARIIGIEEWLMERATEATTQKNQKMHIILEIDPVLIQTLQLTTTWIADTHEYLKTNPFPHQRYMADTRGQSLLQFYDNTADGHMKINSFLEAIFTGFDLISTLNKLDIAKEEKNIQGIISSGGGGDRIDGLQQNQTMIAKQLGEIRFLLNNIDPVHRNWDREQKYESDGKHKQEPKKKIEDPIWIQAMAFSDLVDKYVEALLARLLKMQNDVCVVVFFGDIHAQIYRIWLAQKFGYTKLGDINNYELKLFKKDGIDKCIDISNFQ